MRAQLLVLLSSLFVISGCSASYCAAHPEECALSRNERAAPFGTGSRGDFVCQDPPETQAPLVSSTPPPPLTGGSLTAVGDGSFLIADADRALVWHARESGVLGTWQLGPDDLPGRVLVEGGRAFVVLRRAGEVAELEWATYSLRRHRTCVEPRAVVAFAGEVVVGCAGGWLEALGSRAVVASDAKLFDLRDVNVLDGRLLVSTFRNAQVFEVQGANVSLLGQRAGGPSVVPRVAWRTRQSLVVAQDQQSTSLGPLTACPPYYGGGNVRAALGGVVSTALYRIGSRVEPQGHVSAAVVPVDVAEFGGAAFVASAGTNAVVRYDFASTQEQEWKLDGTPTSVAADASGVTVFVREPASLQFFGLDGALRTRVALGGPSVASTGHELFHRATSQGIACASCHPEAGDDGHVWQFAQGPRRTPTLRGGLAATAPFHWDGDERDIQVLMNDVMAVRMGGGFQSEARALALLHWMDAQPALHPPSVDGAAALRGKALFDSAEVGCAACHSGEQGTNNLNADVGTGSAFQVPRLTEAYWRERLFHDGRVQNLAVRFTAAAATEGHGNTAQLTDAQRFDLLQYVKTR